MIGTIYTMDRIKRRTPVASALFLLGIIAANRLFGMIRTVLLASLFGVSHEAAAFELAQNLTATLYDCTAGALIATMFLPAYLTRRQSNSSKSADPFAATLSLFLAAGVFLLFVPFIFFPYQTVSLVASSLSDEALHAAAASLRPLSFARVLLAVCSLFTGVLQADRKPLIPALLYAASSLVSLPLVFLFRKHLSAVTLSYLLLFIDLGILLFLFGFVFRKHRTHSFANILPQKPYQAARRALNVLLFSAYLPLAVCLSSLFLASIGKDSAVAAGGYALKPILLLSALLFSAFHGVYYPRLAEKKESVTKAIRKPLVIFFCLSLMASAFFFVFAKPILFLFLRNASVSRDFWLTSVRIMRIYALSLPCLTLTSILNDAAYLIGKSGKAAALSLALILGNLFLFRILKNPFGVYAVPLAFFAASFLRALFTWRLLFRHALPKSETIKLLLVLSDCNIGGAGRQMLNYLAHCNKERFDVAVALPKDSLLEEKVRALGFPTLSCGTEASFSLASVISYYRLIRKYRPQILHANASLSARIAALLAGVPIRIYTRHCVYPVSPFFKRKLPRLAMCFATKLLSTSVIAVAEEAANNLYGMGISQKQVCVILNGVDPVKQDDSRRLSLRNEYGIAPQETLAVICGRIEPDKGIRILIEAADLLAKEEQPIKVLIVGKGSEEEPLQNLTKSLDLSERVYFCGFVSDVSPYLNAADVYVNCSVGTEATSLAIAEAMSLSLPIVATSYGGNGAMVKDGQNGILVPPNDPRALADALSIMTDEKLRLRFGKTSYEIYASSFSAAAMAQSNEALYQNLFIEKGYPLP